MIEIATPYILAAIYIICLFAADSKRPRIRVAAVGLWACCVALATLIMYSTWDGPSAWLNFGWTGVVSLSLIWGVAVVRNPPPAPTPTAAPTPDSTFTAVTPTPLRGSHWVSPKPPATAPTSGPTQRRYEARRRRIPVVARERSKHA